jgi:ADP-heptose:LPS heptosyltransferase
MILKSPGHLLVFRFSALGDVAMTVPVIKSLLQQYPGLKITYVSNAFVAPLFAGIERLRFHAADLKGKHKGVKGLFRLSRELAGKYDFDAIADLHNVLRTKILRVFFAASFKPIAVIDKGRKEKKALTRKENKILQPLKPTVERYADVFAALGLPVQLNQELPAFRIHKDQPTPGVRLVGVAPFAQHAEKMYPHDKMKVVLRMLLQHENIKVLLFGGGKSEVALLQEWEKELPGVGSVAGKMSFADELKLIAQLDVMVSMDSANMHLASMNGVPVVSIWGATHPYAGFYGWGQSPDDAVQIDLYCRPCSVFGNKPCFRGDLACMHSISPVAVYEKIMEKIN